MIKHIFLSLMVLMFWSADVNAEVAHGEFTHYFEVDLDAKMPDLKKLAEKYKPESDYDWKYDTYASIGNVFDTIFRGKITTYGGSDERLKSEYEDELVYMISLVPPEAYPYIGPMLHMSPGIPDRIKNMPGIKETKNKFPERIAPELEGMEGLEFLSPYLYFILMPELWPSSVSSIEKPSKKKIVLPERKPYNPKLMQEVMALAPPEDYLPDAKAKTGLTKSDLRTVSPTKNSPITSADIKAFLRTLGGVNEFYSGIERKIAIYNAGYLLDMDAGHKGNAGILGALKDMVNPCQRLVLKAKALGIERELLKKVSPEGFDLKGWAYTCDKTVKAYHAATVETSSVVSLKVYREGLLDDAFAAYGKEKAEQMSVIQRGVMEMYRAPMDDVMEVFKNKNKITDEFRKIEFELGGTPLLM